MNWLKVDDWWEMLIIGIILLGALFIIYKIIKQFFNHGGKVKVKSGNDIIIGEDDSCNINIDCNKRFDVIESTLKLMELQRSDARIENSNTNKMIQKEIKSIAGTLDAILEALQINKIGNGNLEKARKKLALCYDTQDDYLIDRL
jgi:hypothetical protein